jgi:hypothetical protein
LNYTDASVKAVNKLQICAFLSRSKVFAVIRMYFQPKKGRGAKRLSFRNIFLSIRAFQLNLMLSMFQKQVVKKLKSRVFSMLSQSYLIMSKLDMLQEIVHRNKTFNSGSRFTRQEQIWLQTLYESIKIPKKKSPLLFVQRSKSVVYCS